MKGVWDEIIKGAKTVGIMHFDEGFWMEGTKIMAKD